MREEVSAKIKKIENNFQKAVDSGRRSGGGNVVFGLSRNPSHIPYKFY